MIFSSGGLLETEVAKYLAQQGLQEIIDIFGSSETGGIAWRKPAVDERWLSFPGVNILPSAEHFLLHSPYLPVHTPYLLQDQLLLAADGRFRLLGRNDRIVKIEEKRLSLNEMEQALQQSIWVTQVHCRLLQGKRTRIAAVIGLSGLGMEHIQQYGRNALVKQLRAQLLQIFEAVTLPKKWLFMEQLPWTAQGKIDASKIECLLSLDSHKFPQLQLVSQHADGVELLLRVQADLVYFVGHFPGFPVLPGVTQLAWAEKYSKIFFAISQPFVRMEVIKFKKIIRPNEILKLHLKWNAESGKLYFDFSSSTESHSSGRLLYEVAA